MAVPQPKDVRPGFTIETDVLVVGGGAAGLAAAITAARHGARVVLAERHGFCGGAAVAGLSGTVCGLYLASQSRGEKPKQVVFGFAQEFITRMQANGGITKPVPYGNTFTRVHDPLVWRSVADSWLSEAGVKIFYHTLATQVLLEGNERVRGAVLATKQGRCEVRAEITIDASGDADLFAMAGFKTIQGRNGSVQNPTMIFRLQGVDVGKFLSVHGTDTIMGNEVALQIQKEHREGKRFLPRSKIFLFPTPRPAELLCNATRVVGKDGRELNPLLAGDLTEAEINGRQQVQAYAAFCREHVAGCENSFIEDTGVQIGIRQTRQIVGTGRLTNDHVLAAKKCPDGVARCPWPIELHDGAQPQLRWLIDDFYEVPWGCFVPEFGEGILAAGRCLSAEHEAMASARVTSQCFSYGQAVGLAAALAAKERISVRQIKGSEIRVLLNKEGAALD